MSVKEGAVSVQKSETSRNIKVLKGRTGNIVEVVSDRTAIFRDRKYGNITFTEDVLKFSMKEEGIDFISCFPVGRTVHFDIEVGVQHVKCLSVWVSNKQKPNFSCSQPSSSTPQAGILTNTEYRGTVIKMLFPFAFVVEVDSCKIPVLVFNIAFKPNRHATKLCGDQPVNLYVSKGDTVYVRVYRRSPGKEIEWSAWEAWLEESNSPELSTSFDNPCCRIIKKWQCKSTYKTEKKIPNLKGRLSFVGSEIAHLLSKDCIGTVLFHHGNAFLFGVPMKGLRLDQIFRKGEELSFILSGDDANEASCVWFGSYDVVSQSFEERMNSILKYCMERKICESDRTTIIQKLGKQRPPDEDKWDSEDELEETFGCHAAEAYSELSTGCAVGRELNVSCGHKTGVNQAGTYDANEQMTVLSVTASSDTMVFSSVENISGMIVTSKENGISADTDQHAIASKETSSILSSSELTISNATVATKKNGCTSVAVVTTEQNAIFADEQIDFTILTSSTADTSCANESHGPNASTSNVFMDPAIQSNTSSGVPQVTNISLNTNSKVRTDSSKYNCNSTSESMDQSNRATDKEPNSMVAYISEHSDTSDQHKDCGYMDLHKVNSVSFIYDMETKTSCCSNCDTESEFYMSVINKDVECNLKASLMSVLKKQVGESASQILAPYAMGFVKKEIDCMMQELMVKVLSSVMFDDTEQKNPNSDLQFGDACGLMLISMVEEWKKEMLLVTNEWKAEKEKKMAAALDRVRKLGQQVSALCCSNMTPAHSSACSSSSDDNSANYCDENISCVSGDYNEEVAKKSTIMRDLIQLYSISDCQMAETPKSVSEQGSQTISTGCILYLNSLSDL